MGPYYPLKTVKKLLRKGQFKIQPNATASALDDFGWRSRDIVKCLLKLNDRDHRIDREKNHFYKSEPHWHIPNTMMDYYKAKNIMDGFDIYTHFYMRNGNVFLIVSSFKEL